MATASAFRKHFDANMARAPQIEWLPAIQVLALVGVVLNHLVEEFLPGNWFIQVSLQHPTLIAWTQGLGIQPGGLVSFAGLVSFLGDHCPGVFLVTSGLGLTWSALHGSEGNVGVAPFLRRRLSRILPPYIALHVLFLLSTLVNRESDVSFADARILFSILGLRFNDDLFFFISPSWWFVWLILQLYLLFPLLYLALRRLGGAWFLMLALLFTVLSRTAGLLDIRYSESLYFWMLGIFFGTRLAEFCVGMAAAVILANLAGGRRQLPRPTTLVAASVALLCAGLLTTSVPLPGWVLQYLLMTLGLSALFLWIWEVALKRSPGIRGMVTVVASGSYGTYLVHQLMIQRATRYVTGDWQLIAAMAAVLVAFPVGILLERFTNSIVSRARQIHREIPDTILRHSHWAVALGLLGVLAVLEVRVTSDQAYRLLVAVLGIGLVALVALEFVRCDRRGTFEGIVLWFAMAAALLHLFVFPREYSRVVLIAAGMFAVTAAYASSRFGKRWLSALLGSIVTCVVVFGVEVALTRMAPLETRERWGEYPALQVHDTRTYSLKPNQVTHLRYNNYDYTVRTNSLGLNSPEIVIERPEPGDALRILVIGDAFTMPEGLEYEDAYPSRLENAIAERVYPRGVQVINAGVTGYGPPQQYPQLQELVPLLRPDIVLYQFFVDEFAQVRASRDSRLASIGFITGDVPSEHKMVRTPQLEQHLASISRSLRETLLNRPDRSRYEKALLKFYEVGGNSLYSEENLTAIEAYLRAMQDVCTSVGATFVIYFVPAAVEVSAPAQIAYFPRDVDLTDPLLYDLNRPYAQLELIARELGIRVTNLRQPLKEHPHQPVYFADSWHWNREGHRAVADYIATDLMVGGLIRGPRQSDDLVSPTMVESK